MKSIELNNNEFKKIIKKTLKSIIHSSYLKTDDNNFIKMVKYIENQTGLDRDTIKEDIYEILVNFNPKDNGENLEEISEDYTLKLENIINSRIKEMKDKEKYGEYKVIFPIYNLDFDKNFNVGDVYFFKKLDNKKCEKSIEKRFYEKNNNSNISFAKTIVKSTKDNANFEAETKIKIAINVIKLFLDEDFCNFGLCNDIHIANYKTSLEYYGKTISMPNIKEGNHIKPSLSSKLLSSDMFKFLSILLKKGYECEFTDFERRLFTGIFWFGEAQTLKIPKYDNGINPSNKLLQLKSHKFQKKYLYLIICIETIFTVNEHISKTISENISYLIAKTECMDYIKNKIKKFYNRRSKIVHNGISPINQEDLEEVILYTKQYIFTLIKIYDEHYNDVLYLSHNIKSKKKKINKKHNRHREFKKGFELKNINPFWFKIKNYIKL